MKSGFPSISIIIPTLNNQCSLMDALISIKKQNYPKSKIETIIVDGGSIDKTLQIANDYGCRITKAGYRNNQERRRGIGLSKAKGDIVTIIDSDNILPYGNWLKDMIEPLLDNSDVIASQTLHYLYVKNDLLFNRYCALFGINDPVVLFLKKADRIKNTENNWTISPVFFENRKYFLTEFNQYNLPTVGCNGFLIKRRELLKANWQGNNYFHIDVIYDLVMKKPIKVAIIKNSIWHKTGNNFINFFKKRLIYYNQHSESLYNKRRYFIFNHHNKRDLLNIAFFCLASLTFFYPFYQALKGYIKKRDVAWFIHPFLCFAFLLMYSYIIIPNSVKKLLRKRADEK